MKEILLANGFHDAGICSVCGGQAWKYTKQVNNRYVEVKVYGHYENTVRGRTWKERGDAMIIIGGSKTRVMKTEYLQNTLNSLNLASVAA